MGSSAKPPLVRRRFDLYLSAAGRTKTHSVTLCVFVFILHQLHSGAKNEANGAVFKELLQTPDFRITVVEESDTVELCGALKV